MNERRLPVALLTAFAVSTLLGCATSAVSRGAEFYRQGRHIDADLVFEHEEPQLSQLERGERARYALYRGSNYLALGEREQAARWLTLGAGLGRAPVFSAEEQALLQTGLAATGQAASAAAVIGAAAVGAAGKTGSGLVVRATRLSP